MAYVPRRAPRFEMLQLRGIETRLTRWDGESPGSPPLLLLHGFMDTGATFQFLVDAFAANRRSVAIDWRGFGASSNGADGYWFPDYLADLDALLDTLSPDRPVNIVGHSMGGNVAMLYAGVRPERVARLVNLEGIGLPRTEVDTAVSRYREWLDQIKEPDERRTYPSLDALAVSIARRFPRMSRERVEYIAAAWSRPRAGGGFELAADPRHRRVNPVRYRRDEAEAVWSQITSPVLLVLGGMSEHLDHLHEDGEIGRFEALIPSLRCVAIPGAGHMMHLEQPELVAAEIDKFLA
jgi:pimeloyl-ACP methyl ester carboxylesterase